MSALLLVLSGCSAPDKVNRPVAIQTPAPADRPAIAVWIIPMDDFHYNEAMLLAKSLSDDLKLNVRAALSMGSAELKPFPGTTQFPVEEIFGMANNVIRNLTDTGPDTAYLVLTQRDINTQERSLRFNFATHDKSTRTAHFQRSPRCEPDRRNG